MPASVPSLAAPAEAVATAPPFVPVAETASVPVARKEATEPAGAPREDPAVRKRNESKTVETMMILAAALSNFTEEGQPVPRSLGGLAEGFGIQESGRRDAWGRELDYRASGSKGYTLVSAGPDGRFDTDDDLVLVNGRMVRGGVQ